MGYVCVFSSLFPSLPPSLFPSLPFFPPSLRTTPVFGGPRTSLDTQPSRPPSLPPPFPPSFPSLIPGTLDKQAAHQSAKFSVGFSTPYGGGSAEGGMEGGSASGGHVPDATAAFGVERVKELLLARGGAGEGGEEVATMRRKYDDLVSYTSK